MASQFLGYDDVNNAIKACMDKDEQSCDYYEGLQSFRNGVYKYNSNRLERFKEISVPRAIINSMNHQNANPNQRFIGGFFESIHRAYFVRGSSLFLWDYMNSNRWCSLNEFNDEITAVGLVRAKENIFVEKIRFLLIVATKMEIKLLGIGFDRESITDGEIEAFPTKYQVSTDNVEITKILSSPSSTRIFMACDHGNVYEFEYLYKQSFFGQHSRTCTKKVISDSLTSKILKTITFPQRDVSQNHDGIIDLMVHSDLLNQQCLFSLSRNGVITGYKFDDRGGTKYPITKMLRYDQLQQEARLQINQMTDDNSIQMQRNIELIGIFEVDKSESEHCPVMGVTPFGDRLFFAITPSNLYNSWTMELSFIRIRPPYLKYGFGTGQANMLEPCILPSSSPQQVHCCSHQNGVTFLNALKSNHTDCVLLIDRNNMECQSRRFMGTTMELIESVESDVDSKMNTADRIMALCRMPLEQYAEVQYQSSFRLYSRKEIRKFNSGRPFVGLSPLSIEPLLPRPIILCLRQQSIVFYKIRRHIDSLRDLLRQKDYDHIQSMLNEVGVVECQVMALLIAIGHDEGSDVGGQEMVKEEARKLLNAQLNPSAEFVYAQILQRLNCQKTQILAIYLCISRLLRSIWSYPICILEVEQNHKVSARYESRELHRIIEPLSKLKVLIPALAGNHSKSIDLWVRRCLEILNILVMFERCQFGDVYDKLPNDLQALTLDITFEQLMTASPETQGFDLLKSIISLMVPSLDIREVRELNEKCASYFTFAQLMMFLARSQMANRSKLENALDMFCEVCDDDSFDVGTVCNWLRTEKYYNGVVKLVFCIQNKLILRIQALSREEQQLQQMGQMQRIGALQRQCTRYTGRIYTAWEEITKCLEILFNQSNLDDDQIRYRLMKQCLQEPNKDFAFKFYGWFLENQHMDELFKQQPRPRYLEEFLRPRENQGDSEADQNLRLEKLVHYWKEIGETEKMAQLLVAMANKRGFSLQKRNAFLLEAIRACKSLNNSQSRLELNSVSAQIADQQHELEERAHLAQIQIDALRKLREKHHADPHDGPISHDVQQMENMLLSNPSLWTVCKTHDFPEQMLALLSFSNDPNTADYVQRLWEHIVEGFIQTNPDRWMDTLMVDLPKMVNIYNLEKQRWMFDLEKMLKYLHKNYYEFSRLRPALNANPAIIIDALSPPQIEYIQYSHLVFAYCRLMDSADDQRFVAAKGQVVSAVEYLVRKIKNGGYDDISMRNHETSITNPRLNSIMLNNSILAASNSRISDLVTKCQQWLDRNEHSNKDRLIDYFNAISSGR